MSWLSDLWNSLFGPPAPTPPPAPVPAPIESALVRTLLVRQPQIVPTYNNTSPPKDTVGVTLWGAYEALPSCLPTSATSAGGELNIVIDSASIPRNVASRNGLGTIALGFSFKTPVNFVEYRYRYEIRIPRVNWNDSSVAQVVAYYNFHDRVNGTSLWLGQLVFDTRGSQDDSAGWDAGTNQPYFITKAPNFTDQPFSDWRSMTFNIGPQRLAWATQQLRTKYPAVRLSSEPADYDLTHINLNPETAHGVARIDVGVRGWQLAGMK